MKTSEKITNLTKALHQFQSEVTKIKKDSKNPHFKSNYASLANILDAVGPVLINCGLVITSHPDEGALVTTIVHADSGEYMQSNYTLAARDLSNPQQIGSAISYARRYSIQSILNLNTDDDDSNAAAQVEVKKETLTLKSKKWKEVEAKVIGLLEEGMPADKIIKSASSKYELGNDVIQFINDNASTAKA